MNKCCSKCFKAGAWLNGESYCANTSCKCHTAEGKLEGKELMQCGVCGVIGPAKEVCEHMTSAHSGKLEWEKLREQFCQMCFFVEEGSPFAITGQQAQAITDWWLKALQAARQSEREELKEKLIEAVFCIDATYQGEDYRRGFNETKGKVIDILKLLN